MGDTSASFTETYNYSTGLEPIALTTGDFNADGFPDAAVANHADDTVTAFWNDGTGLLAGATLDDLGQQPVDIDAADFNRDGMADLAVAMAGDNSVVVMPAAAGDLFDPVTFQKRFFQNSPSALLADNFDGLNGADVLLGFSDKASLTLMPSDENGIFDQNSMFTIDTLADVVVDPFNNVTLAADSVLSVAGGTGFGGVSSRQGVATITQQPFNVLHFPRSDLISFSVVNMAAQGALLNFELYHENGSFALAGTDTVPPGTQYARYFDSVLGEESRQSGYWVRSFATSRDVHGLWLINDGSSLDYLDGTRIPAIQDAVLDFVLPVIRTGGDNYTTLVLINPNKDPAQAVLTLRAGDGTVKERFSLVLPGRGRVMDEVDNLFTAPLPTDYVIVNSDRAVFGLEVFGDDQAAAVLEGIPTWITSASLYSPHYAVGDLGAPYRSVLTIVNSGEADATIQVSLFDDDGTQQGDTRSMDLPAGGKTSANLADLFGLTDPATGYLKVATGGAAGIAGCITFGEATSGRFLSSLPLQYMGASSYLLGHIANGTLGSLNYFTGLAILNTKDVPWDIQVAAYDQFGILQDTQPLTIQPKQRKVFLLSGLMPDLTAIFGGYILIEGTPDSNFLVFELFGGNDPLDFLSAVPAVPLR
jgi:hypothetical protein